MRLQVINILPIDYEIEEKFIYVLKRTQMNCTHVSMKPKDNEKHGLKFIKMDLFADSEHAE